VQLVLMTVMLCIVGLQFLIGALRNATMLINVGSRAIHLTKRISEDVAIAEFIKSDFENAAYHRYHDALRTMVFAPDLEDPGESAKRRALLFLRHRSLWKELPLDTEWYEAEVSTDDLDQIRVFPRAHWRKLARGNFEITRVVEHLRSSQRKKEDPFADKISGIRNGLLQNESTTGSVVLIGLNESEPMTILDGNHRFVAAVLEGRVDRLRFVCGLSPQMNRCCWYRTNLRNLIHYGNNLVRQHVVFHREDELERLCKASNRSWTDVVPRNSL